MANISKEKLKQLISSTPKDVVLLSSWLESQGYDAKYYRKHGWLESIGSGANVLVGSKINLFGGLYALQTQNHSFIHVGGRSSFSLLGKAHYLELNPQKVILFTDFKNKNLPAWFREYDWSVKPKLHISDFLPLEMGLVDIEVGDFSIKVSGDIRALMECLHLMPNNQDPMECYEFMEGMNNVHPKKVTELLEACKSIKVKRLFLCLSERIGHRWYDFLDLSKVDLGKGKRNLIKNGMLDNKYQITIPKSWRKY